MDKRVYLHIGMHKTGTTALQVFFHTNAAKIQDFCYPKTGRPNNGEGPRHGHHALARSVLRRREMNRERLWEKLLAEIDATSAPTIVLSSEEFDNLKPEAINEVREFLSGYPVTIIAYLRRQDEFVQAGYTTVVKNGNWSLPFDAYLEKVRNKLNYYTFLEQWARAFGKENICVRIYSRERLIDGDTIRDFCTQIGIPSLSGLIFPGKSINRGLPRNVIEIMRLLNSHEVPKAWLADLARIAARLYPEHSFYDIIPPREAKRIVEEYRSSNDRVLHDYLGGNYENLFPVTVDCTPEEKWQQLYGAPHGDIGKTIADLKKFVAPGAEANKIISRENTCQ